MDKPPQPPVAKIVPKPDTLFDDTRIDNYFWLRDRNDPDTIPYLEAENAYTKAIMQDTEDLQAKLYAEMLGRIKQTDLSVPVKRDNFFYYTRTQEGKQYAIYCRKQGSLDAAEEVLLDGNAEAEGKVYFRVGNFAVSPDHKLLSFSTDYEGDETYTIRVKNLETGALLADEIPNTYYSLEWAKDNRTFFYTILDDALRPFKVFRHTLGVNEDTLIYHEEDERFTVEMSKTSSREFLLINIGSSVTSEVRYLAADQPTGSFQVVLPRAQGVEYDLTHHGDSWFIRTNDTSKTFRVIEVPVGGDDRKEVLAGRRGVTVESVHALREYLIFEERDRGLIKFQIQHFPSGETHHVQFDEPAYSAGLGTNAEYDTELVRYTYTSLTTPACVYDYNLRTRERELKKQQEVLGGYDPTQYQTERLHAKAPDGVEVPISLVYRKGFTRYGSTKMLLYGYGAYGISIDPSFGSDRLSLLDRGFIYAIAHIRGGGDLGKPWHEDGRMLLKKNTFTDFIACAEHLIAENYTSPDRLSIMGRSAGGLLMGTVVNMRPDLFAAAEVLVPFVDALNTELDATLPLTVGEWEEWGNPADKDYYDYIKSYSPYDNIEAKRYPKLLVSAGLNDPRVSYWEPAKLVAKLRATKTGDDLLLLKTEMGSGHFGASGRYEYLKEVAFNYAFLLKALDS